MRGQIIQHHPDKISIRVVPVDQIPHAVRKVGRCTMIGDLHMAPRFMCPFILIIHQA
jgi:hypothetical protein